MRLGWFVEFYQYSRLPAPIHERGDVQEERFPWRYGVGFIFRLPFTRFAITVGKWEGNLADEDEDGPLVSMRAVNWEEAVHAQPQSEERQSADNSAREGEEEGEEGAPDSGGHVLVMGRSVAVPDWFQRHPSSSRRPVAG